MTSDGRIVSGVVLNVPKPSPRIDIYNSGAIPQDPLVKVANGVAEAVPALAFCGGWYEACEVAAGLVARQLPKVAEQAVKAAKGAWNAGGAAAWAVNDATLKAAVAAQILAAKLESPVVQSTVYGAANNFAVGLADGSSLTRIGPLSPDPVSRAAYGLGYILGAWQNSVISPAF